MSGLELRPMHGSERVGFLTLMEAAFDETFMFGCYLDHDPLLGPGDTLVALDGGRIVSAVQIFTRYVRLRGHEIALGGIGSVATHPDYERRGISTRLLQSAIDEMRRREMVLSLLFTGRTSFYERLGWVMIPCPVQVVHRGDDFATDGVEAFKPRDLEEIRSLYDRYCGGIDLSTVRDEAYWRGQLVFAGNPEEDFRVLRRGGRIQAYARCIEFMGLRRIIEYARVEGGAEDLSRLIVSMGPYEAPLFVPDAGDAELAAALAASAEQLDAVTFPDQMWRVLDRDRLSRLDAYGRVSDDAALLSSLVGRPGSLFWPADRF